MSAATTLPKGFRVRLADGVITSDDGRLIVGGSPLTAMRLTDRARDMLASGRSAISVTVRDAATARVAERLLATSLGDPDLHDVALADVGDLTVVVPVRDRADQLNRTLAALRPLLVIVVDDASLEPEPVAEVALGHRAHLITLPCNVGPAAARNAGLASVTTPYVVFVDSDVEVTARDITALARHFTDPAVSLVGPRIVGIARTDRPRWFEKYDVIASSLTLGMKPGVVRPGAAVAWLPSACLVARTAALGGGFDPGLRVGEDVDLVWRLTAQGHRVRYDPSIVARHDARRTLRGWLSRKFVYGTGGAVLATRHGNKLAPAVLTPTFATAAALLLLRSPWAVPATLSAVVLGAQSVRKVLPATSGRNVLAFRIAIRGLTWALRQESALLLRHWWPATAVSVIVSRKIRGALVSALVVDSVVALSELDQRSRGHVAAIAAGRRLGDLAYGAGLWCGALRARSARVLLVRRPSRSIDDRSRTPEGVGGAAPRFEWP